jgi:uncharacterized protein HemX
MARLTTPRIRMPRVTRPGRASRLASERTTTAKPVQAEKSGNGTTATATKEAQPATTTPAATPATGAAPATGATTPEPSLQERIEGLQGWMAEVERKQARLTYFGGLAILLALAAGGAGLYFGLTNQSEGAKKSDLDALTKRVDSLQGAVTKNSKDTQNALNASIAQLQQTISGLQKQQAQAQATITSLQSQVKAAAAAPPATTPGAAATTTTTTTTTPKNP